jgi:hypothetical protein
MNASPDRSVRTTTNELASYLFFGLLIASTFLI